MKMIYLISIGIASLYISGYQNADTNRGSFSPIHVHKFVTKSVLQEQTCEADGWYLMQCKDCRLKIKFNRLPATGHLFEGITCHRCWSRMDKLDDSKIVLSKRLAEKNGISLSGNVVIPEHIIDKEKERQVIAIDSSFCYENQNITSIVLPDSVVAIGSFAFHNCSNLESVTWSKNLQFIGKAAFQLCPKLQYSALPDSVEHIQNFAFNHSGKWNTESVHIPAQILRLGNKSGYASHMFYDCGVFQKYEMVDDNARYFVNDDILYHRKGICVSIPSGKIFENNTFHMPEFMISFSELAGNRNKNIQTIVLSDKYRLEHTAETDPMEFTNTGNNLSVGLYGYTDVRRYEVSTSNSVYSSIDGVLYDKNKETLLAVPNNYVGVLEIPEGIVEWKEDAMWLEMVDYFGDSILSGVTEIHIPSTLTAISDETIEGLNLLVRKFGTMLYVHNENTNLRTLNGELSRK